MSAASESKEENKITIYHKIDLNSETIKGLVPNISEITEGKFTSSNIKDEFHVTIFFINRRKRTKEDHIIISNYDQELIKMEGKPVEVNILSFCFDDKAAALKVSIPEELKKYSEIHKLYSNYNSDENTVPDKIFHITYALSPGVKPVYSNEMFRNQSRTEIKLNCIVQGTIGRFYRLGKKK